MRTPGEKRKPAADRLRDIESVTDASLARLRVDELLVELLDRVRDVLRADTAAALLLDEPSGQLVATAARGIEEEVYQGVRIPLGRGFAGRVAATKRPVIIEDVGDTDVINPLLREKGIRSLLGVPLIAGGQLLGVLHVGTLVKRQYTEADVALLQMVADRIALVTHSRLSESERKAVTLLQRSLLPDRLPSVPGLEVAVRYSAGGEGDVGGDWYDLFALPSGCVCVTVGDVVGRGLRAATVMGRLRSAVRAYALDADCDAAGILTRVDSMVRNFEPREMATVVVAVLEPSFERLSLSSAGHPAPILATGSAPGVYLDLAIDPPVGAVPDARRRVTDVDLPPGGVLCFYTDGLVERRNTSLDARLKELCELVAARPVEEVCAQVMSRLIGPEPPGDDVAVLVVRRVEQGADAPLELAKAAVPSSLGEIRAAVRRWLADAGVSRSDAIDVVLAVGEACSNVVEHAYGPAGGVLTVLLEHDGGDVVMTVQDTGRWRGPRGTDRGRGMRLMQSLVDELRIDRGPAGTQVAMRRHLRGERSG